MHPAWVWTKSFVKALQRVLRDVGDAISVIADQPQSLARTGQHGPPHFMTVSGGHHFFRTCLLGSLAHQRQGCRCSKPDSVDVVGANKLLYPTSGCGGWTYECEWP